MTVLSFKLGLLQSGFKLAGRESCVAHYFKGRYKVKNSFQRESSQFTWLVIPKSYMRVFLCSCLFKYLSCMQGVLMFSYLNTLVMKFLTIAEQSSSQKSFTHIINEENTDLLTNLWKVTATYLVNGTY